MAIKLGELIYTLNLKDQSFQSDIKNSEKSMESFGKRADKLGATMSKTLTPAIIASGGAAVKMASDLGESQNALNVMFGEIDGGVEQLNKFGESAAENVGLSQTRFNELATQLGAFTTEMENPIGATIELTERAADVASVFNTDVDDALSTFRSALTGETEPIRRFGVLLNAAAVEAKAMELGLADSSGEISEQAKVSARYALIMEQTTKTQGDFANTSEDLANKTRILQAQMANIGAELGQQLLPLVGDVVGEIGEWVEWFGELEQGTQQTIVQVAGLTAAIGPAIVAIGGVTKAVRAFNTTALFGPAGIIVGLGAAIAAFIKLTNYIESRHVERLREDFGDLAGQISENGEVTDEFLKKIEGVEQALGMNLHANLESVKEQTEQLAESMGMSQEQIIKIGLNSEDLSDTMKETLTTLQDQIREEEALNTLASGQSEKQLLIQERKERTREEAAQQAIEEKRITDEQQKQQEVLDEMNEIAAERREAIRDQYGFKLQELEATSEIEKIEIERQRVLKEAAKDYVKTGEEIQLINEYYDAQVEKIKEAQEAEEKRLEKERVRERYEFEQQYQEDTLQNRLDNLEIEYIEALAKAQELGADKEAIEAWYIRERNSLHEQQHQREVELEEQRRAEIEQTISVINQSLQGLSALTSGIEDDGESGGAISGLQQSVELLQDLGSAAQSFAQGNYVQAIIQSFEALFGPALERVGELFAENDDLREGFERIGLFFAQMAENLLPIIVELLEILLDIMDPLMPLLEVLTRLLKEIFDYLGPLIQIALIPMRASVFLLTGAIETLLFIFGPLLDGFEFLADIMNQFIDGALMWIIDGFVAAGEAIEDFFEMLFGWIEDLTGAVGDTASGVWDWVSGAATNAWDTVTGWFGFANGGEVIGAQSGMEVQAVDGGTPILAAENGFNELLFNEGPSGSSFRERFASEVGRYAAAAVGDKFLSILLDAMRGSNMGSAGSSSSGGGSVININLDGKTIAQSTVNLVNNKVYTIDAKAIR